MFPSTPPETGRDPWADGDRFGPAGAGRRRSRRGSPPGSSGDASADPPPPVAIPPRRGPRRAQRGESTAELRAGLAAAAEEQAAVQTPPAVPVQRMLSVAIAGFAGLLGVGLVFGAQTAGPGNRLPFAVVVLGVQLLFVLAWTMAMRPPALPVVAVVSVGAAAAADAAAILPRIAVLAPLGYVAVAGFVAGILGQLVRRSDRSRVTESLGATLFIVVGVVAFGTLIVLSRLPAGTQAISVCLTATAVALVVARLIDAVLPWPRLAPQVPRGATGVVVGAMCGTLASGVAGGYVVGFTPTSGALVGLVAGAAAVLADLGVGYAEAGRQMAGEAPTMWIARHMQGPLGGFALAAPVAYGMSVFFL